MFLQRFRGGIVKNGKFDTVAKYPEFAKTGGKAFNIFVLDMSRLPVDIDLYYLPMKAFDHLYRRFLLSFASNIPDWCGYNFPTIKVYPSIR